MQNQKEILEQIKTKLSPREQCVVIPIFGMENGYGRTVEEIAQLYGTESSVVIEILENIEKQHPELIKSLTELKKFHYFCYETVKCFGIIGNDEFISYSDSISIMNEILSESSQRDREIIDLRFGLSQAGKTLNEIGQLYNLSRERIRQIEQRTISKIRKKARSKLKTRKKFDISDEELLNFDKDI